MVTNFVTIFLGIWMATFRWFRSFPSIIALPMKGGNVRRMTLQAITLNVIPMASDNTFILTRKELNVAAAIRPLCRSKISHAVRGVLLAAIFLPHPPSALFALLAHTALVVESSLIKFVS